MGDDQQGVVHNASDGGVTGTHADAAPFQFLVAPATGSEFNTAHLRLIPLACWRVDDIRFAFGSSFVTPDIAQELQSLSDLRKRHSQADTTGATRFPPLSIFGHADPVGSDDYNKALSGRRATVIYALLLSTTDPDTAVRFWQQVGSQESWGANQRQTMQAATGLPDGTAATTLIKQYMQTLVPADLQIGRQDFLGQGADSAGKGDYQGCSELNPVLLFSQEDEARYAQAQQDQDQNVLAERNAANAPNRRVLVLLFRVGSKINPTKWPCPRVTEGVAGCKKRFWSDGETRRSTHLSGQPRKFSETQDTFACRFYQRISDGSPCEAIGVKLLEIRASIAGSKGIRNPANQKPTSVLPSSTSPDEALDKNKPVILVRGCTEVDLEAITSPSTGVVWEVKANQNTNAAPTITPVGDGSKAKLQTNQGGSFSVIASLGISRVVWNVVFVSVNVDVSSAVVITRDLYQDGFLNLTSDATMTRFTSGQFVANKFTWQLNVKKIELVGGGLKNDIGIDQVQLLHVEDGIRDTLAGHYIGGGLAQESPTGGVPVVDSNGDANTDPTADGSLVVTPDNTSAVRATQMTDAPAGQFVRVHPKTGKLLQTVDGIIQFRMAVGSSSQAAPNAFVVHADLKWQSDYVGNVKTTGLAGIYTPNGAHTSSDPILTLISDATGGQDTAAAGFELFEPRFNNGRDTKFTHAP